MALTYNTVFGRLGRLFKHSSHIRTYCGTLDTQYADTIGEFSGARMEDIAPLISNHEGRKQQADQLMTDLQPSAAKALFELIDANFSIKATTTREAIIELIRQMKADSKTVSLSAVGVGSVTAGGSNVGNGTLLMSVLAPPLDTSKQAHGNEQYQNAKAESVIARCVVDETDTTTQRFRERFTVKGQRAVPNRSHEWPKGSGAEALVTAASSTHDHGRTPSRNVMANSNFELFTDNVPDRFTRVTGTAGTHIIPAGAGYIGDNALKFVGDGSTNPKLTQELTNPEQSDGKLFPNTLYSISFFAKYATTAPTSSLKVSIVDSSGTIYNNGSATRECSLTVTSGNLTTSYALVSGVCCTPVSVDSNSKVVIEFSGNVANTSEVFVDNLCIAAMNPFGNNAHCQIIAGSTPFREGDQYTGSITNDYAGVMQHEFDRFFGMSSMGLMLPGSGSNNINDNLVS